MEEYLYHGSYISGITELKNGSLLHDTDKKVVYLTDNIPYALLYIWDAEHNKRDEKHVTGWVKHGIAYYEEQFPNQLETFYKGVSGFLYCVSKSDDFQAVEEREGMFYGAENVLIDHTVYIEDVYEELLKYEASGLFSVLRFLEQSKKRQEELIDLIATAIVKGEFCEGDEKETAFLKRHFKEAWERAKDRNRSMTPLACRDAEDKK